MKVAKTTFNLRKEWNVHSMVELRTNVFIYSLYKIYSSNAIEKNTADILF